MSNEKTAARMRWTEQEQTPREAEAVRELELTEEFVGSRSYSTEGIELATNTSTGAQIRLTNNARKHVHGSSRMRLFSVNVATGVFGKTHALGFTADQLPNRLGARAAFVAPATHVPVTQGAKL
jgi:hypothetical protein